MAEQLLRIGGCNYSPQAVKKQTPMNTMELTTENPGITDVFVKLGVWEDAKNKEKKNKKPRLRFAEDRAKARLYQKKYRENNKEKARLRHTKYYF